MDYIKICYYYCNSLRHNDQNKVSFFDLQLFAGEKTEEATPKRKSEARQKGQVAKSNEFNSAFILLLAFFSLKVLAPAMYDESLKLMEHFFTMVPQSDFTIMTAEDLFVDFSSSFLKLILPIMLVIVSVSIIINFLQVGFLFTLEPLQPDFSKLNPITGFGRLFSLRSLVELAKSVVKIVIVSYFVYGFIMDKASTIPQFMLLDLEDVLPRIGELVLSLAFQILTVLLILGILDYYYQWWQNKDSMKMSKEEVKEEAKQAEGNPEVKSKIKEKQRALAMQRMMQAIPSASVVVTNPTHFAVALKYESSLAAPLVIAKGQDLVALKIKEIAKENSIVIVENKPLARTLYASVEIGDYVPEDLYQAVAEVLAYVYQLKNK